MVARRLALTTAIAVLLLPVSGAGGAGAQTPKRGGTLVFGLPSSEPACLNVLDGRCHNGNSLAGIASAVLESPYSFGLDLAPQPKLVSGVSSRGRIRSR